jgi:hypothetical protein
MPGFTVPLGFPYPLPADPTDGPGAIKALADAVDASVVATTSQVNAVVTPDAVKITAGPQNITTGTFTNVSFNAVEYDNTGIADLVSNQFGIVIRRAGVYFLTAVGAFGPNGTGDRNISGVVNGSRIVDFRALASLGALYPTAFNRSTLVACAVGTVIGVSAEQTSGGTLALTSASLTLLRVSS